MITAISKLNSQITLKYLQTQVENQYFERKGLGDKELEIHAIYTIRKR